ncbi:hypothetical protein SDC9_170344 [bioreactor metagenome]|uniref:Uncharacterized protein n=1 Tax=bioreactor metagenome TaxID=1076179 RepID=A0A645GAZ8_9ZZZZ
MEPVHQRVGGTIEIMQRPAGDEVFTSAFAGREEERDVGDLLGEDIDGAVNPHDLLVNVGAGAGGELSAAEPRTGKFRELVLFPVFRLGPRDIESE